MKHNYPKYRNFNYFWGTTFLLFSMWFEGHMKSHIFQFWVLTLVLG